MRYILGISAYYHDAAAALLDRGRIVAAAEEERFSRRKHDERFPGQAIAFCLRHAGIGVADLDAIAFYDKPIVKLARVLETYLDVAPRGLRTFPRVMAGWLSEKLDLRSTIRREVPGLRLDCRVLFTEHHQAHAASAFHASPFADAAILTVDGVGEWSTTTLGEGHGDTITLHEELRFPHSLGLLYSAFTAYCGFRANSGEYKLMGLAPYGEPRFARAILDEVIELKADGSFRLNLAYFSFLHGLRMTGPRFDALLGGPARSPEAPIEPRIMDVAASIQAVTEEVMLRLARHARQRTGQRRLCLAGGVALNCVANGRILRSGLFDALWIQPAAGDAGGALGAALAVWHAERGRRVPPEAGDVAGARGDRMSGALLGPAFGPEEIAGALRGHGAVFERLDEETMVARAASLLAREKVVGWFQGRMEFGPRALGNRSILGDPRSPRMQSLMNQKVKFRESFRPLAPAVLLERASEYFELPGESPYMLLVAPVHPGLRRPVDDRLAGLDRVRVARSSLPAVTHLDYSARIQTVGPDVNPLFHALLKAFEALTGCGVLVNTSFNVRGEPIVCTPDDAYRCFVNTEMDYLVMGPFLLERAAQPRRPVPRLLEPVPD